MRIETHGKQFRSHVFGSLFAQGAEAQEVKSFTNSDGVSTTKTAPTGEVVHRTPLSALALNEQGTPSRQDASLTLALIAPIDVQPGVLYRLEGRVWVTPYTGSNGRIAYSVIADTVVPAKS